MVRTTIEQLAKRQLLSIGIGLTERPLPANIIYTPSGLASGDFDIADLANLTTGDAGDWIPQLHTIPVIPLCRCRRHLDKTDLLGVHPGPSIYIALETWHWRK